MDLSKIAIKKESLPFWVNYRDGVAFQIEYTDSKMLVAMLKASTKRIFDPRTRQPMQELDETKVQEKVLARLLDWTGLTVGVIRKWMPNYQFDGLEDETEVDCIQQNKQFLADNLSGFVGYLIDAMTDYETARQEKVDGELKN